MSLPAGFVTCQDCPPGSVCRLCAPRLGKFYRITEERYGDLRKLMDEANPDVVDA